MSAKSVKGPGGRKPASAATNLIGRETRMLVSKDNMLTTEKLVEEPE